MPRTSEDASANVASTDFSAGLGGDPLIGSQSASSIAAGYYAEAATEPTTSLGIGEGTSGLSEADGGGAGTGR